MAKKLKYKKVTGLKKFPKEPKINWSSVKTDAQIKKAEDKISAYKKACQVVEKFNKAKKAEVKKYNDALDKQKKANEKKIADLRNKISKLKTELKSCKS